MNPKFFTHYHHHRNLKITSPPPLWSQGYTWTPRSPPPSATICIIFFITSACLQKSKHWNADRNSSNIQVSVILINLPDVYHTLFFKVKKSLRPKTVDFLNCPHLCILLEIIVNVNWNYYNNFVLTPLTCRGGPMPKGAQGGEGGPPWWQFSWRGLD